MILSRRMPLLRNYLLNRRCHLCVVGDSTSAQNSSPRKARGILRGWDIPWAGYSNLPFAATSNEGNSGSASTGWTQVDMGAVMASGETSPAAGVIFERLMGATTNHSSTVNRYYLTSLNNYKRGDWTAGKTLTVRLGHVRQNAGSGGIPGICPIITKGLQAGGTSNDSYANGHNLTGFNTGMQDTLKWLDITYTNGAALANEHDVSPQSGTTDWNGYYGTLYKVFWFVPSATTGVSYSTLATSGRNTGHHMTGGDYSDTALESEISMHGTSYPWIVWIQLGININSGSPVGQAETSGSLQLIGWKNNVRSIIQRWRTALANQSVANPIFVVGVPWDTDTGERFQQATRFAWELSGEYDDVCMISYSSLLRKQYGKDWYGLAGGSGALVLADGVHQSTTGTDTLEALAWQEILTGQETYIRSRMGSRADRIARV